MGSLVLQRRGDSRLVASACWWVGELLQVRQLCRALAGCLLLSGALRRAWGQDSSCCRGGAYALLSSCLHESSTSHNPHQCAAGRCLL